MVDPAGSAAGLLFCVMAIQCPEAFAQGATRWE